MTNDRRQRRRRLLRILALLLAAPVLLVTLALVALRLEPVRHAILERIGEAVSTRTGWTLDVEDATFRPLLGDVRLRQLSLTAPDRDRPLLTAEAASLRLVLGSLFGDRPRLRTLVVESPVLDLEQLPAAPPSEDEPSAPFELPVDVDRLALRDGRISSAPGEAAAGWADTVTLSGVDIRGALRSDGIDLRLSSRVDAEGPRLGRRDAALTARIVGTLPDDLRVEDLTVVGPGLELTAEVTAGLAPESPLAGSFHLDADLARLAERQSGLISARGVFDLRARTGRLDASGEAISGALVAPWLPADVVDRYRLGETTASFEVDVDARSGAPLEAALRLDWRRSESTVLQARAEVRDGRVDWDRQPRLDTLAGILELEASALPAEILGPWIEAPATRAALSGGSLELELEAGLDPEGESLLAATGALAWSGRDRGALSLRLAELGADAGPDGGLDLASLAGSLAAEGRDIPAALLLPALGEELFTRIAAAGTTFALEGTAALERQRSNPLAVDLTATWSEAGRPLLVAEVDSYASRRDGAGRLDPDSIRLLLAVEVPGLEAGRIATALGAELAEQLAVAGTRLEGRGSLLVSPGGLIPGAGGVEARWVAADGEELLAMAAQGHEGAPIALGASLEVLPGQPGRRRVTGELRAEGWTSLASARIEEGRVEILEPDVARTVSHLRERWAVLDLAAEPDETDAEKPAWVDDVEQAIRGELAVAADFEGPLSDLAARLDLRWQPHPGSSVQLTGEARPARGTGEARLQIAGLSLQAMTTELAGLVSGTIELSGGTTSGVTGAVDLAAEGLEHGASGLCLNQFVLVASTDGETLRLASLVARHRGTRIAASGALGFALPPTWAELTMTVEDPDGGLEYVALDLGLEDGVARLASRDLRSRLGAGSLEATIPLAALAELPELPPQLAEAWRPADPATSTTVRLDVLLPVLDTRDLAPFLPTPLEWRAMGEDIRLALELEPEDLPSTRGTLEVGDLRLETAEHSAGTIGPLRLRLAGRRLDLTPIRATIDGRPFDIRGHADLEQEQLAVADVRLTLTGNVDLGLLDPLLLGGVGSGPLAVQGNLGGPPGALDGRLVLDGRGGRIDYLAPYVSRFADPYVEATLLGGTVQITRATAVLNEGELEAQGSWSGERGLFLATDFDDVRYRLDYGLSALLAGELELHLPMAEDERGSIQGEVVVERGLVRRNMDLERELLRELLAPSDLEGAEPTGEDIDLDIRLASREGIRVRNNVADLRATWTPMLVRGTLAEPTIDGTVEVEPGGLVFAYGQTLRIDRGTLTLRPEPGAEPTIDLATTASYEDPTIGRRDPSRTLDPFAAPLPASSPEEVDRAEAAAYGLGGYVADRLAAGAGELLSTPLAGTGISIRPIVVYNESDPTTSLMVGRDLTENLTLAVSLNLRQEERRTYLLQVDDLPQFPRMQGQVFTNEQGNEGATVQQTLSFGGRSDEARIRKIRFELPEGSDLDTGPLRGAISIEPREPLPEGVAFDTEIEVSDALRRRGYYSASVAVRTEETKGKGRVDVVLEVDPGPRTEVEFTGDRPTNRQRAAIASLYRADYYERAALEEVRAQTRRALRGEGFLDPDVEVLVERTEADGGHARRIVVQAEGGRRVDPDAPGFPGLDPELESRLQERFATRLARIQLATGEEGALATVRSVLRNFGYPRAQIGERSLSENGSELIVHVDAGPRRHIVHVEITGVDDERARELATLLTIEPGDPVRSDRLTVQSIALEDELRREGFSEARARAVTRPVEAAKNMPAQNPAETLPTIVELRIEPGPRYRLADVELEGARKTRQKWALGLSRLKPGETLTRAEIAEVRRRFYQTGLFSSVYVDTRLHEEQGDTTLVIGVDERPPLTFGYGLRWESDEGAGVVLDVLQRNALGRGIALGARALYTEDRQFGRLYSDVPYIFGSRYTLETFAEIRDDLDEDDLPREVFLVSAQLARRFGRYTTGRTYARFLQQVTVIEDPFLGRFEDIQRTPTLGTQYIYNRRSDPLSGRSGLFASADLSGSGELLDSDREYLRFFGQVNLYRPAGRLFGRQLGWAQSLRLGAAETFDDQLLPDDDAFKAGGEFSIRGYPNESIGPRDPNTGRRLGGNVLLVLNEELHFPIAGRFSGLVFFDAGNVWESTGDLELDFLTSVGAGLRVDSPLGLLRLDLGFPLDRREDDPSIKVYIGFGQVF